MTEQTIKLYRSNISVLLTNADRKIVNGLEHAVLGIARYGQWFHVIHIPTGRSIIAAKRHGNARKALEALVRADIDYAFANIDSDSPEERLKYDLSLAKSRFVITKLIDSGVLLVDPCDLTT